MKSLVKFLTILILSSVTVFGKQLPAVPTVPPAPLVPRDSKPALIFRGSKDAASTAAFQNRQSALSKVGKYIAQKLDDELRFSGVKPFDYSGFRVGGTYVFSNNGAKGKEEKAVMEKEGIEMPFITQFGWQFERQFATGTGQSAGVAELVVLAGGFNQGVIIPSVSGLIGFRLDNGFEFGGGPNITMSKSLDGQLKPLPGFVWATGYSASVGKLRIPLNVAAVQTISGVRVSLMTGFIL